MEFNSGFKGLNYTNLPSLLPGYFALSLDSNNAGTS